MAGLMAMTAAGVMTRNPRTVAPDALAAEALAVMNARKITCLFAVAPENPGQVAGILHIHDCLRAGVA
jgi:arabinose-5-phosphate isomerase